MTTHIDLSIRASSQELAQRTLPPVPMKLLDDGQSFQLTEDVSFNIGSGLSALTLTIPSGYRTNLASIPPEAGILGFEKLGRHSYAALLHDWMYNAQMGFELANAVFYHTLRQTGVPNWRAVVMGFAVQAGGKWRYKAAAKELAAMKLTPTASPASSAISSPPPNPVT